MAEHGTAGLSEDGGDPDAGPTDAGCAAPRTACGASCCAPGERCWNEDTCIPDRGACATNDDCTSDTYCADGICVPWGVPAGTLSNAECTQTVRIEAIEPDVQCRWTGPPAGDAHPDHVHVMATPTVVDFDFDDDPATLEPSIVFTSFPTAGSYRSPGVLRVIDGATCAQQFTVDAAEDATMSPASVALGDLDGDGRAEIVAAANAGGLLAQNVGVRHPISRYSPWEDFTCGESNDLVEVPAARFVNGSQWHTLSFLGEAWAAGGVRYNATYLADYVRAVNAVGGVVTVDAQLFRNGSINAAQVAVIGAAFAAAEARAAAANTQA